jgi:hypothetical protein
VLAARGARPAAVSSRVFVHAGPHKPSVTRDTLELSGFGWSSPEHSVSLALRSRALRRDITSRRSTAHCGTGGHLILDNHRSDPACARPVGAIASYMTARTQTGITLSLLSSLFGDCLPAGGIPHSAGSGRSRFLAVSHPVSTTIPAQLSTPAAWLRERLWPFLVRKTAGAET